GRARPAPYGQREVRHRGKRRVIANSLSPVLRGEGGGEGLMMFEFLNAVVRVRTFARRSPLSLTLSVPGRGNKNQNPPSRRHRLGSSFRLRREEGTRIKIPRRTSAGSWRGTGSAGTRPWARTPTSTARDTRR